MIPPASPDVISVMASPVGRLKRGFRQLVTSPATWALVAILILLQGLAFAWSGISSSEPGPNLSAIQATLGLSKDDFLSGKIWQALTYAFIHGNWPHLALNGAAILILGSKLEHIVAKRSYLLLCLFSTLGGAAMFLLLSPNTNGPAFSRQTLVGASAICFAFLVFLTTLSPDSRFLPVFLSGKTIGLAIILTTLAFALLNPELPTGFLADWGKKISENGLPDLFAISHACHLGGALTGWIYARYILRPRITLKSLQRAREKAERTSRS